MTGLGVFFRDQNPLIIDLQLDSSRGVCSRTKENMSAANRQLGKSIKRQERVYSHLANSVNAWA